MDESNQAPLWRRVLAFSPTRFLCRGIARFPKSSFCLCFLVVQLACILALLTLGFGQLQLATFAFFEDRTDELWENSKAFQQAQREANNAGMGDVQPRQSRDVLAMSILFCADDDDVFTRDNLERMRKVEQHILAADDYDKYCFAGDSAVDGDVECEHQLSVLDYFYPERLDSDDDDNDGLLIYNGEGERLVNNITRSLELMAQEQGVFEYSPYFVGSGFRAGKLKSKITRIVFNQGMPLKGYDSIADIEDFNDMKDDIDEYQVDFISFLEDENDDASHMRILWLSDGMANDEVLGYVQHDFSLALISVILMFLFLWYQLASFWLASTGVMQVVWTFPFALLIYRWIFWQQWVGSIHIVAVFVVLGVGVDDIFISVDAFKQSASAFPASEEGLKGEEKQRARVDRLGKRLEWSWRRSAQAMLVTSLTTMAAFITTAFSPILTIGSFGLFAAILVFADYILVTTLFFCSIAVYGTHFEGRSPFCCVRNTCWPCLRSRAKEFPSWRDRLPCLPYLFCCCVAAIPSTVLPYEVNDQASEDAKEMDDVTGASDSSDSTDSREVDSRLLKKKVRPLEALVRNEYSPGVGNKWGRWVVLLYFLILTGLLVLGAVWTAPADEETDFIPKGYNFRDALDLTLEFKSRSVTDITRVSVVWGVDGLDLSGSNGFDENDLGEVDYDKSFRLDTAATQQHILNICATARFVNDLRIRRNEWDVRCFLADFNEWVAETMPLEPLPVVGPRFEQLLRRFVRSDPYTQQYDDLVGFVDDKLRFVALQFNTTLDDDDSFGDSEDMLDAWEDYIDKQNDKAPEGVDNAYATTPSWTWIHLRKLLFRQALIGMFVALPIAFVVLVLFTLNIVVSLYAIISMLTVVCGVLMFFVATGWDIGAMESIACILVVGLSVDSSVHIANAYVEAPVSTRLKRTRYALNTVGVSVLSGGISTILAALPLVLAIAIFFKRFGIIIIVLIAFSQLMSFGLLCSMLATFGPQHGIGDLRVPLRWLKAKALGACGGSHS